MLIPLATVLSVVLAVFSLFTLSLGAYATARRRASRGAGAFALLMASIAVYCLGYAGEVSGGTLERIMPALRFEYFGIATLPAFWIFFAVRYTCGEKIPAHWLLTGLLLPSAFVLAALFTNGRHHLYYRTLELSTNGPFLVLVIGRGPFYYVGFIYVFVSLAVGIVLFLRMLVVSPPMKRPQAVIMLAGSLVPGITDIVYQCGASPWGMDPSPFAMTVTACLYAVGLFRFHLLDVVPVALDTVFRTMRDGVIILDCDGRVADFNARARTVLQATSPLEVRSVLRESLAARPDLVDRIDAGQRELGDVEIEVGGEPRQFDFRVSLVRNVEEQVIGKAIIMVDTTERARLLEEVRRQAVTDELTGLYNRRHFMEHAGIEMDRALRTGKPVSAVTIDLDYFKRINDAHGHAAGDAVLRSVSALWREHLRATDILGRCGGEEFTLLLPETPLDTAVRVAEKLREATAALPVETGALRLRISASFGVAVSREGDASDPAGLLARADAALYEAKERGRNQVRITAER